MYAQSGLFPRIKYGCTKAPLSGPSRTRWKCHMFSCRWNDLYLVWLKKSGSSSTSLSGLWTIKALPLRTQEMIDSRPSRSTKTIISWSFPGNCTSEPARLLLLGRRRSFGARHMLLLWWVVRWSLCFCIESEIVGRTTPVLRGMRQVGRTVTAILCNFHPPLVPVVEGRRDFFSSSWDEPRRCVLLFKSDVSCWSFYLRTMWWILRLSNPDDTKCFLTIGQVHLFRDVVSTSAVNITGFRL